MCVCVRVRACVLRRGVIFICLGFIIQAEKAQFLYLNNSRVFS